MVDVELTPYEITLAAGVGLQRQVEALRQGRPDVHGFEGDNGWTLHIEGALGELAVAKVTGRFWNGSINTYKDGGDVGRLQVRTRSRRHYELIVRPDDRDQDAFILVVGTAPRYRVVGWIYGADAKQDQWWQTHGGRPGAWFVPQTALRPVKET